MIGSDRQLKRLVRKAVVELGSVNRLAIEAGVPQPSLNQWLNGKQESLSWSVVSKLLDYLEAQIV
jgi:hypothetical protein